MNPVIEGSTVVSQVCAMPRARVTSESDPLAAAAGVGPGGPARAFILVRVGPPGSTRPSAKAGTCIFWNFRIPARVALSQVAKTAEGGAGPPTAGGASVGEG